MKKRNVVLIGMPSCGKSTIGKLLAQKIGKAYVDMDAVIVEKAQMSIPEIFSKYGEAHFRNIESEVAIALSTQENLVISTGGGIIKFEQNMKVLSQKGVIIFIDRDLDLLVGYDPNRPLSSSKEAVTKLYEERYTKYCDYAHYIVKNNSDITSCIKQIEEVFMSYDNTK